MKPSQHGRICNIEYNLNHADYRDLPKAWAAFYDRAIRADWQDAQARGDLTDSALRKWEEATE